MTAKERLVSCYRWVNSRHHPCEPKEFVFFYNWNYFLLGVLSLCIMLAPATVNSVACSPLEDPIPENITEGVWNSTDTPNLHEDGWNITEANSTGSQNFTELKCCCDKEPTAADVRLYGYRGQKEISCIQKLASKLRTSYIITTLTFIFCITPIFCQFGIIKLYFTKKFPCPAKKLAKALSSTDDRSTEDTYSAIAYSFYNNIDEIRNYVLRYRTFELIVIVLPAVELILANLFFDGYLFDISVDTKEWISPSKHTDNYHYFFRKFMDCFLCKEKQVVRCLYLVNHCYDVMLSMILVWHFFLSVVGLAIFCRNVFSRLNPKLRERRIMCLLDRNFIVACDVQLNILLKKWTQDEWFLARAICSACPQIAAQKFLYHLSLHYDHTGASAQSELSGVVTYRAGSGGVTFRRSCDSDVENTKM